MTAAAPSLTKKCPQCASTYDVDAEFCPRDGARLEEHEAEDPYIGQVISGHIELQSVAGIGAMGKVYRARQKGIERDVAVKILHRELSTNAQLVHRFHREARIASKLRHPHVVEVHLAGQLPDGALYIVMEYLDGSSLATVLQKTGPLPLARALGIAMQIADAVGEAHALGIVHRDLKPDNVMLVRRAGVDDWAKVLDFGIARIQVGEQSMETAAGRIFGTARYMSPEAASGGEVGSPGDVYAIATIVYEMLAGRTPFDGPPLGLLIKHLHEAPPPLGTWPSAAVVPEAIARVVMDNLAKTADKRAQTARAFADQLAAAAREVGVAIPKVDLVARVGDGPRSHRPSQAVDPTVPDEPGPSVIGPTPLATTAPMTPLPVEPIPTSTSTAGAAASANGTASASSLAGVAPPSGWSRVWPALVALAFVLGIASTILVKRRLDAPDAEHAAYVSNVRHVLSEGHYVAPPGENVKELVAQGLERWPKDTDLEQLRSEAEHEMITMAIAARESGDVVGARNLARDAYALDPTDNSARFMRAQAEDDLAAINAGPGLESGPPRLVFESPPVVRTGAKVEMRCRVVPGTAGAKAKITALKVTVMPNGQTTGGAPVTLTSANPADVRMELTAPAVGSWDVAFEANVGGTVVRAMRDLDVTP